MNKNNHQSEIRKHYFLESYVIFAPKRAARPQEIPVSLEKKHPLLKETCEFCPKNQKRDPIFEIKERDKWTVRVIPNRFPALTLNNPKAYGKQEIVIETPNHNQDFSELPIIHVVRIIDTYIQRTKELSKDPKIKYILTFKNEGGRAGASIAHDHSQIIALPLIPPDIQLESNVTDEYLIKNSTCPYCDAIKKEIKEKVRIVYLDEHIVVISPYATSAPYGVWIMPRKHTRSIDRLNEEQKYSLAKALLLVTGKLNSISLAYNFFIHNSLEVENHHLRIKFSPRLNIWGGLELGSGVIINPVFPEEAARFYRNEL